MYIINNYSVAVAFCIVTMLCWGSWANTSKISTKNWPIPDVLLGLFSWAYTCSYSLRVDDGKHRFRRQELPRGHPTGQSSSVFSAAVGGVVFNFSNLLIVAAITVAGLSVAFPIGVGLALVIGVVVNLMKQSQGNPLLLFSGVLLIVAAVVVNAFASSKVTESRSSSRSKGILLSVFAGIIMGFFYRFVADSMTLNFTTPTGETHSLSAVFVFSIGLFFSNFIWNIYSMYMDGNCLHMLHFLKGMFSSIYRYCGRLTSLIPGLYSFIASDKAGPAISYGLGQGSTMIGAAWGVFVFKEFKGAPPSINRYPAIMFVTFIIGLGLIVTAKL